MGRNRRLEVANLHNRYERSEEDATTTAPAEYKWAGIPAATPIYEGALANVTKDASDNRQSKCLNTAEQQLQNLLYLLLQIHSK